MGAVLRATCSSMGGWICWTGLARLTAGNATKAAKAKAADLNEMDMVTPDRLVVR